MSSPTAQKATPSNHDHTNNPPVNDPSSDIPSGPTSREVKIPFFIYLVKYDVKKHSRYMTSYDVVKAYPTVQQANQEAIRVMKKLDSEEQKRSYNERGCVYLNAEKEDGRIVQVVVKRMRVRWPGEESEESEELDSEGGEGGEGDEEAEEREKSEGGDLSAFEEDLEAGRDENEESR